MADLTNPRTALSTFRTGRVSSSSGGSAVQVSASCPCKVAIIKAHPTNSGNVYISWHADGSPANNGDYFVLDASESISIEVDDLNKVYFDVEKNGDYVCFAILR